MRRTFYLFPLMKLSFSSISFLLYTSIWTLTLKQNISIWKKKIKLVWLSLEAMKKVLFILLYFVYWKWPFTSFPFLFFFFRLMRKYNCVTLKWKCFITLEKGRKKKRVVKGTVIILELERKFNVKRMSWSTSHLMKLRPTWDPLEVDTLGFIWLKNKLKIDFLKILWIFIFIYFLFHLDCKTL